MPLLLSTMFFLIAAIEINMSRQSIYWLTGSFNYIYPLFLFFAYFYCITKIENKKYYIASIIVGLLSAATMEQSSMMTFGLTLLVLLSKFKEFKNIKNTLHENKKLLLLLAVTLIGTCSVLLSPSQFIRISHETKDFSLLSGIANNLKFMLTFYTRSTTILIYSILFNIMTIAYVYQNGSTKEKQVITFTSICNILLIIFNFGIILVPSGLLKLIVATFILITFFINIIYLNIKMYKTIITPITITLVLLIGSQFMMIVSPIIGYRNLIFGTIMFAYIICIIAFNIKIKSKIPIIALILLGITFNLFTANGYYQNKKIDCENFKTLDSTSKEILADHDSEITLKEFKNDNYAWCVLYKSESHLGYFKEFYKINCKINWE